MRTRYAIRWSSSAIPSYGHIAGWGLVTVAAGTAAALGLAPAALVGGALGLGGLAGVLGSPLVFLWVLVAISGVGFSWADQGAIEVAGRTINPAGLHWGLVVVLSAVLLTRNRGSGRLPRAFRPYAALVALAAVALLWAPDRFLGLKQFLQYLAPLLVFLLAYREVSSAEDVQRLRGAFVVSLVVAAGAALSVELAQALGREAEGLSGALGSRIFAIYLLPVAALTVAGARHRSLGWGLATALVFGLVLLTLSRMAVATFVVIALLSLVAAPRGTKVLTLLAAGALLVGALQYEPFRNRLFLGSWSNRGELVSVSGEGTQAELRVGTLQLTGRGLLWVQTVRHAMESPLLGHGTGSASVYLSRTVRSGSEHPHNEYLRVFHDFGIAGSILLVLALAAVGRGAWRRWQAARGALARELALAGGLAWVAYGAMAVTDNVMIYVSFFTQNVFILLALAWRAVELEGEEPERAGGRV